MRRFYTYITMMLLAAVVGSGCSHSNVALPQGVGSLKVVGIGVDTQTSGGTTSSSATKTAQEDSIAQNHIFEVIITDKTSGQVVESYPSQHNMPMTIVLEPGTYTVVARTAAIFGQVPNAGNVGFETPQYAATNDVTIEENAVTTISLTAQISTAIVSVEYDALFEQLYPCTTEGETYRTEVSFSGGDKIIFAKGEKRKAHYLVKTPDQTLNYQLFITRKSSAGELETVNSAVKSVAVQDGFLKGAHHYKIIVGLQ